MINQAQLKKNNPFIGKATSKSYENVKELYDSSAEYAIDFLEKTASEGLVNLADYNIFDIGSGTGVSSEALYNYGFKNLNLLDPSPAMAEQAKERLGDKVNYIVDSAENIGKYANNNIDIAFALNSVHLYFDFDAFLNGLHTSLKDDMCFVFNLSMPSYRFYDPKHADFDVALANIEFYKKLYKDTGVEILKNTYEYFDKVIWKLQTAMYDFDIIENKMKDHGFQFINYADYHVECPAAMQRGIWDMVAKAYIEDPVERLGLIHSVDLKPDLKIRQAYFAFQKKAKA